jgi:hypothetical protein
LGLWNEEGEYKRDDSDELRNAGSIYRISPLSNLEWVDCRLKRGRKRGEANA